MCVYVVLVPVYGFATLQFPPAGVPDNTIDAPEHPLTFAAVTAGNELTVIVAAGKVSVLDALHPFPFVIV